MGHDDLVHHALPISLKACVIGGHGPVADAVAPVPRLRFAVDPFLLVIGQPLDEGVREVQHLLDERGVRPEVRVGVEGGISLAVGHVPLDVPMKVAHARALARVLGAVHRHHDRRDRPLDAGRGVGEEHRVVEHPLAQLGQHVLQHGGPRADQVHPVVAEVLPHQRFGAKRKGVRGCVVLGKFGHATQCYRFRTLYPD
jgi:hypothetical protein